MQAPRRWSISGAIAVLLGRVLIYQSSIASTAGMHDTAIHAAREGVWAYRKLDDEPHLAWALHHLAKRFTAAKRFAEARDPAQQTVALYEQLVATDPATYTARLDEARQLLASLDD